MSSPCSRRSRALAALLTMAILALSLALLGCATSHAAGGAPEGLLQRARSLAAPPSPEAEVGAAWERARAAGSYRFTADSEQTLYPRAAASSVGQQEQHIDLRLEGAVELPDRAEITLEVEGAGGSWPSTQVSRDGGRTFVHSRGETTEIQDALGVAAPTTDMLGWLAAVENVRRQADSRLGGEQLRRFTFEVSGQRLSEHLRDEIADRLGGNLPVGTELQPPPLLARSSGTGEIWLDEEGLPLRQVIELRLPEATADYDAAARLVVDFSDFGQVALGPISPVPAPMAGGREDAPAASRDGAAARPGQLAPSDAPRNRSSAPLLPTVLFLGLCIAAASRAGLDKRWWRRAYAAVVFATIFSLVSGPTIRAATAVAFFQKQRARAELPTMGEALGLDEARPLAGSDGAPLSERAAAAVMQGDTQPYAPVGKCSGDNDPTVDSDGDGLDDYTEGCLGTDVEHPDTDGDLLNDRVEVEGADGLKGTDGQMHSSDPMLPDSNDDGLVDGAEWPEPYGSAPDGKWDFDGDGVANVWDDDNDGDGIHDGADLSPYFVSSDYVPSFSLDLSPPTDTVKSANHYRYVYVQVQPEHADHLRYSLHPLDWPWDELGQIKNITAARENVELVPFLAVETNVRPSMAGAYGLVVGALEDGEGYSMYVPLSPSQEGGRIEAFVGGVAYTPDEANGLTSGGEGVRWDSASLVWVAMVDIDRWRQCQGEAHDSAHCRSFETSTEPVASYPENLRLAGLQLTSSGPSEIALLGTPRHKMDGSDNAPDDAYLANGFMGLVGTFLVTNTIGVADVASTYRDPTAALTRTFGMPSAVDRLVDFSGDPGHERRDFEHRDAAWATTNATTTIKFLDSLTQYERTVQHDFHPTATILFAYTDRTATRALGNLSSNPMFALSTAGGGLAVGANLGFHTVDAMKAVRLQKYKLDVNQWRLLTFDEVLADVEPRLGELTSTELLILRCLYIAFLSGQATPQMRDAFDYTADLGVTRDELEFAYEKITDLLPHAGGIAELLFEMQEQIGALPEEDEVDTVQKIRDFCDGEWFSYGWGALSAFAMALTIALPGPGLMDSGIDWEGSVKDTIAHSYLAYKVLYLGYKLYASGNGIYKIVGALKSLENAPAAKTVVEGAKSFEDTALEFIAEAGHVLAAVMLVGEVGYAFVSMIWTMAHAGGDVATIVLAAVAAMVDIVWDIVFFILELIPGVDVIVALLYAFDALVYLISWAVGNPIDWLSEIRKWIAWAIVHVDMMTGVGDAGIDSSSFDTLIVPPDGPGTGLFPESRYIVSADFYSSVCAESGGSMSDVRRSLLSGWWDADDSDGVHSWPQTWVPDWSYWLGDDYIEPGGQCTERSGCRDCRNTLAAGFMPIKAMRNAKMTVRTMADYKLRVRWTVLGVSWREDKTGTVPDESHADDANHGFDHWVDVVPNSISGWWWWSADAPGIINADVDADDLLNASEVPGGTTAGRCDCQNGVCTIVGASPPELCTVDRQWDSDGDGLSDGFELLDGQRSSASHPGSTLPFTATVSLLDANPSRRDTDGDGLSDLDEFRNYTSASDPDTDDDGLTDGEEVRRYDATTQAWVGGWQAQVVDADGRTTMYWVSSNPLHADADGDHIIDSVERVAKLSPYAKDEGLPRLTVALEPSLAGPQGQRGSYVAPGKAVKAEVGLDNTGTHPITSTFSVCVLGILGKVRLTPETEPTAHTTGSCDGGSGTLFEWPFTPAVPLPVGAAVRARIDAVSDPSLKQSAAGDVRARLTYGRRSLERRSTVTIDADAPIASVLDPMDGAALRGEAYVVGGAAKDATSWIDRVAVAAAQSSWTITDTLPVNPWAVTWMLPTTDGHYTVEAQATDAVGNRSARVQSQVVVDNTPPTVTLAFEDGACLPQVVQDSGGISVTLTGTAVDVMSGLGSVQLSVDRRPWQTAQLYAAYPTGEQQWSHVWRLPGAAAQGRHTIAVRGVDRAGNMTDPAVAKEAVVDLLAPGTSLSNRRPALPVGTTATLLGHADETASAPLPTHPEPLRGSLDAVKSATVHILPESWAEGVGARAAWIGDLNGDGRADAAVGLSAFERAGEYTDTGKVAIVYGRAGDWAVPPDSESLGGWGSSFVGEPGSQIGSVFAPAGDVNDDGISDLVIGDPSANRLFVVFGQGGPMGREQPLSGPSARVAVVAGPADGQIGSWLASAGDVNADGYADLLVGATGTKGRAYLLLGQSVPPGATVAVGEKAAAVLPLDPAGAIVAGVGNVTGDRFGYDDFVVADPRGAVGGSGPALFLFAGSSDYQPLAPGDEPRRLDIPGDALAEFAGASPMAAGVVGLGDVDGDAIADFAYTSGDNATLVYGREEPTHGASPPWPKLTIDNLAAAVTGIAAVGDVDHDGRSDLVVGVAGGTAYGWSGQGLAARPAVAPEPAFHLSNVSAVASAPYSAAADLNCDGSSDLLVVPAAGAGAQALDRSFGPVLHVAPDSLPVAHAGSAPLTTHGFGTAEAGGTAHVSPRYCARCDNDGWTWGSEAFSSIRAAIDSGAHTVLVQPGVYREHLDLTDGLEIMGAGADLTIVQPSAGTPAVAVADGVADVAVARLTLAADGLADGLVVRNGARGIALRRAIVRDTRRGVVVDSASAAEIVNTTIIDNGVGLQAEVCANADVRNTILAYQTTAGVTYASCASGTALNQFNLYWQPAGTPDVVVGGASVDASELGQGQVLADPQFVDHTADDFRLGAASPAIEAGEPDIRGAPGGASRVDIGYVESGQASFSVRPAGQCETCYCETCANDGLVWQVDAFDRIQDAVDAAERLTAALDCSGDDAAERSCPIPVSIGVGPGTYDEQVSIPSGVRLLGSGATGTGRSWIEGPGNGSTVTVSGAAGVEVSGFKISGFGSGAGDAGIRIAGPANDVTLARSLVVGQWSSGVSSVHSAGVAFDDGAAGRVWNNTVTRCFAGVASRGHAWVDVRSTLVYENNYGLNATAVDGVYGRISSDYNLLSNARDYMPEGGADPAIRLLGNDINVRPADVGLMQPVEGGACEWCPAMDSPAIGAGDPVLALTRPESAHGDIGYRPQAIDPVSVLLGRQGLSCATGNSGLSTIDVGLAHVPDATVPESATRPTQWATAALSQTHTTGSYWSLPVKLADGEGLYRLYTRARDAAGNVEERYVTDFIGDRTAPVVSWVEPTTDLTTGAAGLVTVAEARDYVPTGRGWRFSVANVYFEVTGPSGRVTAAADWLGPAWMPDPGSERSRAFTAAVPLVSGAYEIRAVAEDEAGHVGRSAPLNVTVADGHDMATITQPTSASALDSATVELSGFARFSGAGHKVSMFVDDAPAGNAVVAEPAAAFSAWRGEITLGGDGRYELKATAAGEALSSAAAVAVTLDTTAPDLTVVAPVAGTVISGTVALVGTASDSGSGVGWVEASFDGGTRWVAGIVTPTTGSQVQWRVDWQPPSGSDFVSMPLHVRAGDVAGGQTMTQHALVVDNVPPREPADLAFAPAENQYVGLFQPLTLRWAAEPLDGSGEAQVLVRFQKVRSGADRPPPIDPDWVPGAGSPLAGYKLVAPGSTQYSRALDSAGDWYAHLAVKDGANNISVATYGPWHAGTKSGSVVLQQAGRPGDAAMPALDGSLTQPLAQDSWLQPIVVDGHLDLAQGEWSKATELLDVDVRSGHDYELYAAWDSLSFYLGWISAGWRRLSTMYVYFDVEPGGSSQPIAGGPTLAFEADRAVSIHDGEGAWWSYASGWQIATPGPDEFAYATTSGAGGEVRVPLGADRVAGAMGMAAFGIDDGGEAWAVFPTTNTSSGPMMQGYSWSALLQGVAPNEGQPRFYAVTLLLDSDHSAVAPWGSGTPINFTLDIENTGALDLPDTAVELEASPGLGFETVAGAVCDSCPPLGNVWLLAVSAIGAKMGRTIEIGARIENDLQGLAGVTVSARLTRPGANDGPLGQGELAQAVDSRRPSVEMTRPEHGTLRPGRRTIGGVAHDAVGLGLARVEVREAAGEWSEARGTVEWSAEVDVPPAGEISVEARAVDAAGQVSEIVRTTFQVDDVAPTVELDGPAYTDGVQLIASGTAHDPYPDGAHVRRIEIQVDDGRWLRASATPIRKPDGTLAWRHASTVGRQGAQRLRARAVDAAGNIGPPSDWYPVYTSPLAGADLEVRQIASASPVQAGDALTLTVTVTNNGPAAATEVRLIETLPAQADLAAVPEICQQTHGILDCALGSLASGGETTLELGLTVHDRPPVQRLLAVATVSAAEPDAVPANNSVTTVIPIGTRWIFLPVLAKHSWPVPAGP